MKIWYAPYVLNPLSALNRFQTKERHGFLIKFQNKEIDAGYADCLPIAEFGDGSVEVLLKKLRAKKYTPLLKRSLHLAKVDGKARSEKKSLFSAQKIKSHYTCSDIQSLNSKKIDSLVERGFTTIKVKVGSNPQIEAVILNKISAESRMKLRWRFDANCGAGDQFLKNLDENFRAQTDFIEDPLPFQLKRWTELSEKFDVQCAYDRPIGSKKVTGFRGIRVLKPAREAVMPRKVDIITNSMDHPVGQSFALWAAQTAVSKFHGQTRDYGLQTAHLFKSNPFFEEIKTDTPYFRVSDGYGVGFNDLLERQEWLSV